MALKPSAFGKGGAQKTREDVESEAAAELRRALSGGDPRPGASRSPPRRRSQAPALPGVPSFGRSEPSVTPDDEKQALTELALQQFAEREVGSHRPDDPAQLTSAAASPEEMRNRALAELAERQARMALENPRPQPQTAPTGASERGSAPRRSARPGGVVSPSGPRVKRTSSDMPGAPRLTVAPTLTSSVRRSPVPDDILSPKTTTAGRPGGRAGADATPATGPAPAVRRREKAKAPAAGAGRSNAVAIPGALVTDPPPAAGVGELDLELPTNGRRAADRAPGAVTPARRADADGGYDPDEALAASSHCMMAALSMLLGSFEVLPPPRYDHPGRDARYDEIAREAAGLRDLVERFLDDLPD